MNSGPWVFPVTITFFVTLFATAGIAFGHGEVYPSELLAHLFPDAQSFSVREFHLDKKQIEEFEKKLGTALKGYDRFPRFFFAWGLPEMGPEQKMSEKEHARMRMRLLAVTYFVDLTQEEGNHIQAGIVLDTNGKIRQIAVFDKENKHLPQYDSFIQEFIGKGIDEPLQIGVDLPDPNPDDAISKELALEARKVLLLFYASFAKK